MKGNYISLSVILPRFHYLDQPFSAEVPRNPRVPRKVVRGSSKDREKIHI
jgi:hypothetical protein